MCLIFNIIGSNDEYYFLSVYNKSKMLEDGVYFRKIPINFFDFINKDQPVVGRLFDIEAYLVVYYEDAIENGFLTEITEEEFYLMDINYIGD